MADITTKRIKKEPRGRRSARAKARKKGLRLNSRLYLGAGAGVLLLLTASIMLGLPYLKSAAIIENVAPSSLDLVEAPGEAPLDGEPSIENLPAGEINNVELGRSLEVHEEKAQAVAEMAPANAADTTADTASAGFDRQKILADHKNLIHDAFSVPEGLKDRVGFWFDVYSKYDDNSRIIHHSRYPWIVYDVVNVSNIINAPTPRRRWMRNLKAEKRVDAQAGKIRSAIKSLARRRNLKNLNSAERLVAQALRRLGGDVHRQARLAQGKTRVQVGQRNFFEEGLKVSPRYLNEMEQIFAAKKLPIELSRLPFVESSFNQHATSKVGASGIWQFMGNTGRKFMIVNDLIDERRSPFKATESAARLLKENHTILYRSWPLALTAYNHGPAGVRRAAKAAGSKDLATIIRRYQSKTFNFASSNFYCEFLAALHTQTYRNDIWGKITVEPALDTHSIRLPRPFKPSQLIRLTGFRTKEFLLYNPDLARAVKLDRMIPSGFRFHVPASVRSKIERLFLARSDEDNSSSGKPNRRSKG